jgi:hypothetical protein
MTSDFGSEDWWFDPTPDNKFFEKFLKDIQNNGEKVG